MTWSDELHKISYDWSVEQAAEQRISHDKFNDRYQLARNAGVAPGWFAENVAYNYATSWPDAMDRVVEQWMTSEGHRKNIMNSNFTRMAVGTVWNKADMRYYFTQLFS